MDFTTLPILLTSIKFLLRALLYTFSTAFFLSITSMVLLYTYLIARIYHHSNSDYAGKKAFARAEARAERASGLQAAWEAQGWPRTYILKCDGESAESVTVTISDLHRALSNSAPSALKDDNDRATSLSPRGSGSQTTPESMIVPRAYKYGSPPQNRSTNDCERAGMMDTKAAKKEAAKKLQNTRPTKPSRMWMVPAATISQPVIIPTRSQSPQTQNRWSTTKRSQNQDEQASAAHRTNDSPPPSSTAVHSIKRPKTVTAYSDSTLTKRESSSGSLDGTNVARPRKSLSSSNPHSWDILQSPPEESDTDSWSLGSDSTIAPLSSFRSVSTDSMPSLDIDLDSPESVSHPITPGRSARRDRRLKSLTESLVEECGVDHPLSPTQDELRRGIADLPEICETETVEPEIRVPVSLLRSSFKSNLTASIRVLRSAARSFSNMALQRDEFLTRSILSISPQYTDERRPVLTEDVPDPALRRYLNPTTMSPSELFYHDHRSSWEAKDRCTASIQLQTYKRASTTSKNATVPPMVKPSMKEDSKNEPPIVAYSASRQREPRENSDFLRVIVLEMNMRKAGKLNDVEQGRARIWLPPRQLTKQQEMEDKGTPRRWLGIVE